MTRTAHALVAALALAVLVSGCSLLGGGDEARTPDWDPQRSLTAAGAGLAGAAGLADVAPTYDVEADVRPATGSVSGTVRAEIPAGAVDALHLRYFAGLPDLEAAAGVGEVVVDGERVEPVLDRSLLRVPLPAGHGDRVRVTVPFSYRLPPAGPLGGPLDALGGPGSPGDVGLLSRHEHALNLGHWFPLWIPAGNSAAPDPAGFGDIGSSPAALIRLTLSVPRRWQVVDGGVRTGSETVDGTRTVTSEGYGMNDLVVSVLRDYAMRERTLGGALEGVVVRAHAPREDETALAGVLQEAVTSVEVLSGHLADYPWRELDVVSAPLGAGVAGMEWPGATWIEPSLFTGGIPGLSGIEDLLGDVGGLEGLDDLLGGLDGDLGGLVGGDAGLMLETMRAWTVAHEVGHQWWHVLVGNDSVLAPAVDEPLAQYSACLVLRELGTAGRGRVDDLCDAHIEAGYEQMRLLGDPDAPAGLATDEFASATQYAGVVYGKAAAFYRRLEDRLGRHRVTAALGAVTERHAFDMLTVDELREALGAELDDPAFDRLWRRWMEGTRGDRDLGVTPERGFGDPEGAPDGDPHTDPDSDPDRLGRLLEELFDEHAGPERLGSLPDEAPPNA